MALQFTAGRTAAEAKVRRQACVERVLLEVYEGGNFRNAMYQLGQVGYAPEGAYRMVRRAAQMRVTPSTLWPKLAAALLDILITTAASARTNDHAELIEPEAATIVGELVDGDGFKIDGTSYRLFGIDAFELDQTCEMDNLPYACGEEAAAALEEIMQGHQLSCRKLDTDRYGRIVVDCESAGLNVSAEMVRRGWALDYLKYSKGRFRPQEAEAKAAKRGAWAGSFMPPWQWRKR